VTNLGKQVCYEEAQDKTFLIFYWVLFSRALTNATPKNPSIVQNNPLKIPKSVVVQHNIRGPMMLKIEPNMIWKIN